MAQVSLGFIKHFLFHFPFYKQLQGKSPKHCDFEVLNPNTAKIRLQSPNCLQN